MNAFEVDALEVKKNRRALLAPTGMRVAMGECVVILGENGAGKSLFLRASACLDPDSSGQVQVGDRVFSLPLRSNNIGPWPAVTLVFQNLVLWPHLNAKENILLPWRLADRDRRYSERQLAQLMDRLEIRPLLAKYPIEISGGERQRVALARAFALRPDVLLLDEPSAALDARQAIQLAELLNELKRDGAAIVCATHNLGFGSRIANRYLFIERGICIASGLWSELTTPHNDSVRSFLDLNAFSPRPSA